MSEARATLIKAMAARDELMSRVTAATNLALKAACHVSEIDRRRVEAEQVRNDHIADRAADLRKALVGGEEFHRDEVRSLAVPVLREIEEDLAVARHAHADLVREQEQAQYDLASAEAALHAAVSPVVLAEADAIADEIEELESRARALRLKLHGVSAVWGSGAGFRGNSLLGSTMGPLKLSAKVSGIINSPAQAVVLNDLPFSNRSDAGSWQAFADALKSDPNAVLEYQPPQHQKPDPSISPPPSQRFEDRPQIVPFACRRV